MKQSLALAVLAVCSSAAFAQGKIPPRPHPLPLPAVAADLRVGEKPVAVSSTERTVERNAFFRRVRTEFVFTNPNGRAMEGEVRLPLPDGAVVCGYELEINGELVPGVVCEKQAARVAFENETRKGVDPGLVEQVAGLLWKTRVFPLEPGRPRRAAVEYVVAEPGDAASPEKILERDGTDFFLAERLPATNRLSTADRIRSFSEGTVLWDASLSAAPSAAAWRRALDALPETGDWTLVVFRDAIEPARAFSSRSALLQAVEALVYDGGTAFADALRACAATRGTVLVFSDEIDTLGMGGPVSEGAFVFAGRGEVSARPVEIRKLAPGEEASVGVEAVAGRLLATVWASRRMEDLAAQADSRKDEFLALGRAYGVAGPGLSLIVLETLDQWLEHKIEPPSRLRIHDEWVRCRAAQDDPIAAKKRQAEHDRRLLTYWEERVAWWNSPKPERKTPSSSLFDADSGAAARAAEAEPGEGAAVPAAIDASVANRAVPMRASVRRRVQGGATVTLVPWNPKTPYLDALAAAPDGEAYAVYLKAREAQAASPAFYLDCAGWFFGKGETRLAERIISNLAEFRLEDAALWRTMGWRLREAGSYGPAVRAFRKVLALRGEEPQSRRDLALVLMESGKRLFDAGRADEARAPIEEAMRLFAKAAFEPSARRSGVGGNDMQASVSALEELNGLVAWVEARTWPAGGAPVAPTFDPVYRRALPVALRIVMSWDADATDIDLHVLEPNGEEAFYGNRRTTEGGFVSEDVTTGYGPETYMRKTLDRGTYKILSNYFASRQTALTGPTTVSVTVYTDWGTLSEKRRVLTLRLDKPKEKCVIGDVVL